MNASSGNESINDSQFVLPASRRAMPGGGGIDVALITGMVVLPPIVAFGLELRSRRADQATIHANARPAQGAFAA